MRQPPLDPRTLQSIFLLLFIAQLAFLGVIILFMREGNEFIFEWSNVFHWALPIGVFALDRVSWRIFQQRIFSSEENDDMLDRVNNLQGAYIVLWVMVQVGTFLLLIFAMLKNNDYYILLGIVQIIFYSFLRPRLFNFLDETGG